MREKAARVLQRRRRIARDAAAADAGPKNAIMSDTHKLSFIHCKVCHVSRAAAAVGRGMVSQKKGKYPCQTTFKLNFGVCFREEREIYTFLI